MIYDINPTTFAVSIYNDGETVPFWYQPDYPNWDKFNSFDEAETWAKLAVASHTDAFAPYAPNGKGLIGNPKPTAEEIAAWQAKRELEK